MFHIIFHTFLHFLEINEQYEVMNKVGDKAKNHVEYVEDVEEAEK